MGRKKKQINFLTKKPATDKDKFTADNVQRFLTVLASGTTIKTAAETIQVAEKTIRDWRTKSEEFNDLVDKALGDKKVQLLKDIESIGEKREDWRAKAWILERSFPDEYGNKQQMEIKHEIIDYAKVMEIWAAQLGMPQDKLQDHLKNVTPSDS